MEDILRDVHAMISGNKQLRTAFRTMQAERDQLRATVAGLQRALEDAPDYIDNPMTGDAAQMLRRYVNAALAASPDEHARRIKAEALRATANELESLRDHIQAEVGPDDARDEIRRVCLNRAKDLRDEADRLEATNER